MEELTNSKGCMRLPRRPPTLGVHDNSHAITKLKPKVRIVHIFAPVIIKTDPANFRELVQRLTWKPTKRTAAKKKKTLPMTINGEALPWCKRFEVARPQQKHEDSGCRDGVERELKEEEVVAAVEKELRVENSTGGFFRDLGEIDGFLQGLGDLPLLPLSSSQMDDLTGEAVVP
ncbi:VQ motif-containing protein 25-like [Phoenix dactylifera]|uniref:VQ motif-containing protein 25-like n=1 Tax=Phoenix dactylifera TaxID=42345 RepID=A0A8B7D4Y9_PHODC|nr:VQ motif-containing protein 25-like [Phoenix dactylifera]